MMEVVTPEQILLEICNDDLMQQREPILASLDTPKISSPKQRYIHHHR